MVSYPGCVTDYDDNLIATHYLTSIDEVTEHLRAANQLGLGVRVHSYLEADEDGEGVAEHWQFDLLTSSPETVSDLEGGAELGGGAATDPHVEGGAV